MHFLWEFTTSAFLAERAQRAKSHRKCIGGLPIEIPIEIGGLPIEIPIEIGGLPIEIPIEIGGLPIEIPIENVLVDSL